jgi:short-subunit dehydrogenase
MKKPRVIVITGASAGVGRAAAKAFARTEGAHVGLIARSKESLESTKREIEYLGGNAVVAPCDVADAEAVEAAATKFENELGPIDVWVNNAMTSVFAFVKETTPQEFKRVTEVCYLGYVNGTLAALKRMAARDHGHIIQVGSALAYRGIPLQAAYCASKHAIQGFMDSLRAELIHDQSRIVATMVQMPALNTPQFDWCRNKLGRKPQPVPPIYQPEIAAEAIVFASRTNRREIYVGASTVMAVIGNKLLPGLGDYYLAKTGIKSQQTSEVADPSLPGNLYETVPGDPGAHGRFDRQTRRSSWQLWADKNRLLLGGVALTLGGIAACWICSGDSDE